MKEQNSIELITLEDNEKYIVVDAMAINNTPYVYLSKVTQPDDICVRKAVLMDRSECLVGLDSEYEVALALKMFKDKQEKLVR